MGALKTTARIMAVVSAFTFLVIGCAHTGSGRVGAFIACGICVVVFLLLKIPTKGDVRRKQLELKRSKERVARYEAEARAMNYSSAETRKDDGTQGVKGALVAGTVLHVLASPFIILARLLKMQK